MAGIDRGGPGDALPAERGQRQDVVGRGDLEDHAAGVYGQRVALGDSRAVGQLDPAAKDLVRHQAEPPLGSAVDKLGEHNRDTGVQLCDKGNQARVFG